jgi:fucose permease
MIVIGGAGGSVESIGTTLLAHESQNKNFIYFSQFFYALGAFIAPLLISILLSKGTSIPSIALIIGTFSVVIGILVAFLLFGNKSKGVSAKLSKEITNVEKGKSLTQNKGVYAGIFLAMMIYVVIESSIASWLPTYFEASLKFKPSQASSLLTSFWAGLMASRLWYSFYQKKRIQPFLIGHAILMLVFFLFLFLFRIQHSYILIIIGCFMVGVGCGPIWPLLVEYCSKLFNKQHFTMYLIAGGSFGALSGPSLTALIFSYIGIESFFLIIFCYAMILLFSLMIGHSKRVAR